MKDAKKRPPTNLREELFHLPNLLTYGRILVIPLIVYIILEHPTPRGGFWAALLFGIAAITDFLDGWLARNMKLESVIGKFLDPLADKLIVMACFVCLVQIERVPAWLVAVLLAREISITGLRSIASTEGLSVDVSQSGKLKTALQLIGLIGLLIGFRYPFNFLFATYEVDFAGFGLILIYLSLVFSLGSGGSYFLSFFRALDQRNRAARTPTG